MKKLLIGILIAGFLFSLYYKFWTSDYNERRLRSKILNCIDSKLKKLKISSMYQSVFKEANSFYQTQKDSLEIFKQIKVPVERKFDEYIFFNIDSTKCILMLLEKYPGDFSSGYVHIIKGHYLNKWTFTVGMHISFPNEDIKSLFPKEYKAGIREYNFDMLSKRSRIGVLNDGNPSFKNCNLDENQWFKRE